VRPEPGRHNREDRGRLDLELLGEQEEELLQDVDREEEAEEAAAAAAAEKKAKAEKEANTETKVTVSVADGEVSWVEIEVDGKSDVAEQVTGPWKKTYTVTDSITIQVSNPTAVSVKKNGKKQKFDSKTAGVGSITIQGTKVTKTDDSSSSSDATSTDGQTTDSATGTTDATSSDGQSTDATNGTTTTQGRRPRRRTAARRARTTGTVTSQTGQTGQTTDNE
jgi:hypothetical protein